VHPELAAPVDGTANLVASGFEFSMHVERLGKEFSPRQPYTDDDWSRLQAAGAQVDAVLASLGLAVTMGGEPTWTSREHPELPEWNTEALGATKWQQGKRLARELLHRLGNGPVPMQRMGKLYPGESLPRWALDLIWRKDSVPVLTDHSILDLRDPQYMDPVR